MENLRKKMERDNRSFVLESLIDQNLTFLSSKAKIASSNPLKYDDSFYLRLAESGGREVDALFDFIQKSPLSENEFGKDQELDTLYCLAYEFLALKHKAEIPQFILDYREMLLQQLKRGEIIPTKNEEDWLILIRCRENLRARIPNGIPAHLN